MASSPDVAVIGGGVGGLAAAYHLSRAGYRVALFERDRQPGGLAGTFLLGDLMVERFYHFICTTDHEYFISLRELGLADRLRWRTARMGLYHRGRLHPFGAPWDLLTFPGLSPRGKIHFARGLTACKRLSHRNWNAVESIPAPEWLVREFGEEAYRVLHEPLLRLKFGPYAEQLSAAWMWARIHRVGKSRTRVLGRELLGYVEGGSQVIVDALAEQIVAHGGTVEVSADVDRISIEQGRVTGLRCGGKDLRFHCVLSAIPLPILGRLLPDGLPEPLERVRRTESMGVLCIVLRTRKRLSRHFWINISDPEIRLAGIIEYTNLNPLPAIGSDSLVYLPRYLPSHDPGYAADRDALANEFFGYLERMFGHFSRADVREVHLHREEFAQPLCKIGFPALVPDIRSPIHGLYVIDSFQVHPDDRTISNSLGLGRQAAHAIRRDFA